MPNPNQGPPGRDVPRSQQPMRQAPSSWPQHGHARSSSAYGTPPPHYPAPPHYSAEPHRGTAPPPYGTPQHVAPPLAPPPRKPIRRTWLLLPGAAVLTIVVVVIAVVATRSSSSNEAGQPGAASQPHPGMVSGTQDNWVESVCITGTFVDGQGGLPGSFGGGLCRSRSGHSILNISRFDSDYKMRNGIAMMQVKHYVAGIEPDGTVISFSTLRGGSADALEPLTQFGFTVNTAPTP